MLQMRKRDLLVTVGDDGEDQRNIVKFWAVDQDKRDIRGPCTALLILQGVALLPF